MDNYLNTTREIKNQEQHHELCPINQELQENKHNMSNTDSTDYIKKYLPVFHTV